MKQRDPASTAEMNGRVPDMAIHAFFKNLQVPSVNEGFASVESVPFYAVPDLTHEQLKLLTSFLM